MIFVSPVCLSLGHFVAHVGVWRTGESLPQHSYLFIMKEQIYLWCMVVFFVFDCGRHELNSHGFSFTLGQYTKR